jgi:hypothetical protein
MRIKTVLCKIQYRYRTVRYFAMYGTVPVLFYGTSKCIYPTRDADYCFYEIFFLLQSSLACNASGNNAFLLPAVVGRCLHLAPAYHRCPYPASDRPSSTHHPDMFSIDLWLNVFYVTLRLLVAVPQEDVSKKTSTTGPCTRWDKPSFSPRPG